MKSLKTIILGLVSLATCQCAVANVPDSVEVYLYSTVTDNNHDGLHWAWSADGRRWVLPDVPTALVSSDYGSWGSGKRMLPPFVLRGADGVWHALWSVNENDPTFAHASSEDLISWKPQDYPMLGMSGENCIDPEASYDSVTGNYLVTWMRVADADTAYVGCMTPDFKSYSAWRTVPGNTRRDSRVCVPSVSPNAVGTIHRISRNELNALIRNAESVAYRNMLSAETYKSDSEKFRNLKPLTVSLNPTGENSYGISPMLMGVFFEDISRAADGGLYAELVQNRDFEYDMHDRLGRDKTWNHGCAWRTEGSGLEFKIDSVSPIHPNNPHYAVVMADGQNDGALVNTGFVGISLKKGEKYDFSMFARSAKSKCKVRVSVRDSAGTVSASAVLTVSPGKWRKMGTVLKASSDVCNGVLSIEPLGQAVLNLDMVSLFPQSTFKGRKNGLRRDLAEAIADLHPRFVRFPGGCVAHGDGLHNIYRWKNTIGPLEARVPQRNIWGYHQTAGLGYHEYFQFCEDLGAEPLPVVAAGVPCQNSSDGGAGQQGGIPMDEMPRYVQDILDLVEYANGDAATTRWGAQRAANGHPAPFGMKYLGIGNEDLISDIFKERFAMIYEAVRERYPEITVIGTVGPFHEGSDYEEGWDFAAECGVPMVDEHYYEAPGWFLNNQNYYDGYDRSRPHVYLGEYASRGNRLFNALAEAAYLCGVERNADVVEMTSYAPLLAKEGQTNWNPDLIYFTNNEVHPTVNYEVQRMFGQNSGTSYVPARLMADGGMSDIVGKRLASSVVRADNGDVIVKLVNVLPVDVTVDLSRMELPGGKTSVTVLSGEPSSREASVECTEKDNLPDSVLMSPYSFTVIRVSAE